MRSPDTQKSIQLNINNALAANHKYIPESTVIDWLKPRIERLYAGVSIDDLIPVADTHTADPLAAIDLEIEEARNAIRELSRRITKQGEYAARVMQEEIDAAYREGRVR